MIPNDLVSFTNASAMTGVSVLTLRRWAARGLVTVWGRRGSQRVSVAEVMPRAPKSRKAVYYTPGDVPPAYLPVNIPRMKGYKPCPNPKPET